MSLRNWRDELGPSEAPLKELRRLVVRPTADVRPTCSDVADPDVSSRLVLNQLNMIPRKFYDPKGSLAIQVAVAVY